MPAVSVVLMSFNQENFIRDAVRSLLGQDYSPLEIVISDDCSTDATFDIIEEEVSLYRGPHEIRVHRNTENLRGDHLDVAVRRSRGEFIVMAHGDDIAMPHRVSRLVETWKTHKVSLVSSNSQVIDDHNRLSGLFADTKTSAMIELEQIIGHRTLKKHTGTTDRENYL